MDEAELAEDVFGGRRGRLGVLRAMVVFIVSWMAQRLLFDGRGSCCIVLSEIIPDLNPAQIIMNPVAGKNSIRPNSPGLADRI